MADHHLRQLRTRFLESDLIVVAIGQGIETRYFEEHGVKSERNN
ncbi:MAG: hypothetical protein ACLRYP_12575 [Lachnospira eligens]